MLGLLLHLTEYIASVPCSLAMEVWILCLPMRRIARFFSCHAEFKNVEYGRGLGGEGNGGDCADKGFLMMFIKVSCVIWVFQAAFAWAAA